MNDHEKFKWINDKIGYRIDFQYTEHFELWNWLNGIVWENPKWELYNIDIRKTIFLPCFKNTFSKYLKTIKPDETIYNSEYNKITENLSDPIGFLANLIWFKE